MTDRLPHALDTVDEELFTRHRDGRLVTQSTAADGIIRELNWLDVPPGARVLEIGTGSGYSAALLAALTGPDGHVVTIDVDPSLTVRAAELFNRTGLADRVTALTRDGAHGAPEHGPFDRVVAWTTPPDLPGTWVDQTQPGAAIVTPVDIAPLARTARGILRVHIDEAGRPVVDGLRPGGYVDMHHEVLSQWLLPPRLVDAHTSHGDQVWWLSAPWLRSADKPTRQRLLTLTQQTRAHVATALDETENSADLTAWLLATLPDELTTAGIEDPTPWIGASTPTGIALINASGDTTRTDGDHRATQTLTTWITTWRTSGRPGWRHLQPELRPHHGNWQVRARVRL